MLLISNVDRVLARHKRLNSAGLIMRVKSTRRLPITRERKTIWGRFCTSGDGLMLYDFA